MELNSSLNMWKWQGKGAFFWLRYRTWQDSQCEWCRRISKVVPPPAILNFIYTDGSSKPKHKSNKITSSFLCMFGEKWKNRFPLRSLFSLSFSVSAPSLNFESCTLFHSTVHTDLLSLGSLPSHIYVLSFTRTSPVWTFKNSLLSSHSIRTAHLCYTFQQDLQYLA